MMDYLADLCSGEYGQSAVWGQQHPRHHDHTAQQLRQTLRKHLQKKEEQRAMKHKEKSVIYQ